MIAWTESKMAEFELGGAMSLAASIAAIGLAATRDGGSGQ